MAYGKIKADTLVYDDSGSDVEKTIASLAAAAPTASPTFTGDVTLTGSSANVVFDASDNALEFADNAKATFGTDSDLEIYHDGSNSKIQSDASIVLSSKTNGPENYIKCHFNNAVELYFNNSKKIETTTDGVLVTGTVSDSKGELRTIPQLSKSSAHTIIAGDAGQHSINSSGGWVINTSTGFTAGSGNYVNK